MNPTNEQFTRIASYGIIIKNDEILLCRISDKLPKHQGYWTLPGGKIEFGESPEEAMIREVFEETGLTVQPESILGIDSEVLHSESKSHHQIRIIYKVSYLTGNLVFEQNGTTDMCHWLPVQEVFKLPIVDLVKTAVKLISSEIEK